MARPVELLLTRNVENLGIVGDIVQRPTAREREPAVWSSSSQRADNFMSAVLRVQGDPASYQRAAQDAVLAARADIPIYYPMPLTKVASDAMWSQRFFGGLFTSFAGIALFLAAIGIYGVMTYSIARRSKELGIRLALGAAPAQILRLVMGQGLRLAACGIGAGLILAALAGQALAAVLYGISAWNPLVYSAVALLLTLVAALATFLPAWRATRIDPATALRGE